MRRGAGAGLTIGVLVIVALFVLTLWPYRGAPPPSETNSAPPTTTAPTTTIPAPPMLPPPTTTPPGTSTAGVPKQPPPPSRGGGPPGPTTGGSPTPGSAVPSTMPAFPWPPPRYSAFATIVRDWVAEGSSPTLGSAGRRLEAAFDRTGYGERSHYWVPGGFALVSRIEQIRPDATPVDPPARWAIDSPQIRTGFIDYIRALFNAPPGFYRVIVFVVTDQDFSAGPRPPSSTEAQAWASSGSLRLPASLGNRPYTADHYTSALIYEFERRADRTEAEIRTPSNTPGQGHLEKTGLWQALAQR